MLYGLWSSTAGGIARNAEVDAIANNLANINTTGFRKDMMVFRGRDAETREDVLDLNQVNPILDRIGGGLFVDRSTWDPDPGPIQPTGRSLDVAIDGPGFFAVRKGDRTYYTRAGNFTSDAEGFLRTADGKGFVLNTGGDPIQLPDPNGSRIDKGGNVVSGNQEVATLARVTFEDPGLLRKVGETLFEAPTGARTIDANAEVLQGHLENSSVNAVEEMTRMILALREYEGNLQMIRLQDESLDRLVNDVGRIPR